MLNEITDFEISYVSGQHSHVRSGGVWFSSVTSKYLTFNALNLLLFLIPFYFSTTFIKMYTIIK